MNRSISVCVVGAGPSGVSTVGCLLEAGYTNILWIDRQFQGGAFQYYWGIPANTRSMHLSFWANYLTIFQKYQDDPKKTVDVFQHYEPTEIASLDQVRLSLIRQISIIRDDYKDQVKLLKTELLNIKQLPDLRLQLKLRNTEQQPIVNKLILCIGAEVKKMENYYPHIPRLDIIHLMSPFKIEKYDFTNKVVDVYGSRNSGLLILRNLVEMKRPPALIRHFTNQELVYAEYVDDFIRHNFSGLKGIAKDFGKLLEDGQFNGKIVRKTFSQKLEEEPDFIAEAIGFQTFAIPFQDCKGNEGYELKKASAYRKDGTPIPNLQLVGFVNPREIVDKEGEKMQAIGVFVFLEHAQDIIKNWEAQPKL